MIYPILIFSLFLNLFTLGARPFDGDEGAVLIIAKQPFLKIFEKAANDVHPPFYHLLLHFFITPFLNPFSARLLGALAGVLAIYFLYLIVKKILSQKTALLCCLLFALSPYFLYFSQEVRMYSLFVVLSLGSVYFFLKILDPLDFARGKKNFLFFGIFSLLALYTHYLFFLILFSQIIYLIFNHKKYPKTLPLFIVAVSFILILFLPWLPFFLNQIKGRASEQPSFFTFLTAKNIFGAFYRFGSGRIFLDINFSTLKILASKHPLSFLGFLFTLFVPLVLFLKGILVSIKEKKLSFLYFLFIISILVAFFSSEIGLKAVRYLVYLSPIYFIFLTLGFLEFWKKKYLKIICFLFILISLFGIYDHLKRENEAPGVNKIAEFIKEKKEENQAVLLRGSFGGGETFVFNYYSTFNIPVFDIYGDYKVGNLKILKSRKPEDEIEKLKRDYRRIWFYDLTYQDFDLKGEKHYLGQDKENKDLILWEID